MPIAPFLASGRSPSPDPAALPDPPAPPALDDALRARLLTEARAAVAHAAARAPTALPDPAAAPQGLRVHANSFVTLMLDGRLRGCVGSIDPVRALIVDVADNARRAAVGDPRFPPLAPDDLSGVGLSVAVLGEPQPLPVAEEAAAVACLAPGRHGVILAEGDRRGVFLPKVWEMVPEPAAFLAQLKAKAGLSPDRWSPRMRVWRFVAAGFGDDAPSLP